MSSLWFLIEKQDLFVYVYNLKLTFLVWFLIKVTFFVFVFESEMSTFCKYLWTRHGLLVFFPSVDWTEIFIIKWPFIQILFPWYRLNLLVSVNWFWQLLEVLLRFQFWVHKDIVKIICLTKLILEISEYQR